MPAYLINEGAFEIPAGWQDKSVIALVFPANAPTSEASLTVTRDPAAQHSESLSAYVDRQLVDMARTCAHFDLIRRQEVLLFGVAGQTVEYTWRRPDGKYVQQLQVISLSASGDALVFTGTASTEDFPRYERVLRDAILSFRFH
jgi:hypothetical protein